MRTSRVSRDTSKILAATRTQNNNRSRPLRHTRATNALSKVETEGVANEREHESSIAVQQPDSSAAVDESSSDDGERIRGGKRRRGEAGGALPVVVKEETTELAIAAIESPKKERKPTKARRVPAKKVKAEDGMVVVPGAMCPH